MGKRLQLTHVHYFGEHPAYPQPKKDVILVIDDAGIHLRQFTEKFVVPWPDVTAAAIEGPDQAAKRVTVTRLVGLGIFAFAAKKNTSEAFIQIDTADYTVSFMVPKTAAGELRARLAPWVSRLPEPGPAAPAPTQSTAAELTQLAALRDQGVLSEEEFAAEKARVLGR